MPLQYTVRPSHTSVESDSPPSQRNVYFSIFAGRQRYMSVLVKYLDVLLQRKCITEVTVWNFAKTPQDVEYCKELCKTHTGFKFLDQDGAGKKASSGWEGWCTWWNDYYKHYEVNENYQPEDILIKCDDDVMYIDVDEFQTFVDQVKDDGLYYPNIINNDVCAFLQSKHHLHQLINEKEFHGVYTQDNEPLSQWFRSYDKAAGIHNEFLKDPKRFVIPHVSYEWKGRISVNMFAGKIKKIREWFKLYFEHGNRVGDEGFFSSELWRKTSDGGSNVVVLDCPIVHFGFCTQSSNRLDTEFLPKYQALASKLLLHSS